MKKTLIAVVSIGIIYMVLTAFLSRGDTYLIESNEPLQDIVIICDWSSSLGTLHGGTHSVTRKKALVVESDKPYNCGINLLAGLSLSFKSSSMAKHPTHTFAYVSTRDGVIVSKAISKLVILDDLKARFEAGEWDKYRNPGFEYANNLIGCGFGHQYFDYYSEVKEVDVEHFKKLYHEPMLECMKRTFVITKKYRPAASSQLPSAEVWMEKMWVSESWEK